MANDYQNLIFQVAELRRQMGSMVRNGTVDEVKGDKLRINYGDDKDGKKVLSARNGDEDIRTGRLTCTYVNLPSTRP